MHGGISDGSKKLLDVLYCALYRLYQHVHTHYRTLITIYLALFRIPTIQASGFLRNPSLVSNFP